MITKFNCKCGNNNPQKATAYDGAMGYEAVICTECGRFSDHNGEHEPNNWSKEFVTPKKSTIKKIKINITGLYNYSVNLTESAALKFLKEVKAKHMKALERQPDLPALKVSIQA